MMRGIQCANGPGPIFEKKLGSGFVLYYKDAKVTLCLDITLEFLEDKCRRRAAFLDIRRKEINGSGSRGRVLDQERIKSSGYCDYGWLQGIQISRWRRRCLKMDECNIANYSKESGNQK